MLTGTTLSENFNTKQFFIRQLNRQFEKFLDEKLFDFSSHFFYSCLFLTSYDLINGLFELQSETIT